MKKYFSRKKCLNTCTGVFFIQERLIYYLKVHFYLLKYFSFKKETSHKNFVSYKNLQY